MMSPDISRILREWPYEGGQINVRLIEGEDGEPRIQMRLDLGLLQMETTGRPDASRPNGFESFLEYCEARIDHPEEPPSSDDSEDEPGIAGPPPHPRGAGKGDGKSGGEGGRGVGSVGREGGEEEEEKETEEAGGKAEGAGKKENGSGKRHGGAASEDDDSSSELTPATLSEEECRLLREEAVQYYHRYIALLVLGDYDGVLRDTARNLRVIDLCAQFAETEEDRAILEQFRPYVTMMRVRALASQMVADDEPKAALWAIDDGIEVIRKQYEEADRGGDFEDASEIQLLRSMRNELALKLPASQKNELRERLRKAIESENYELAAILRDELRMLKE